MIYGILNGRFNCPSIYHNKIIYLQYNVVLNASHSAISNNFMFYFWFRPFSCIHNKQMAKEKENPWSDSMQHTHWPIIIIWNYHPITLSPSLRNHQHNDFSQTYTHTHRTINYLPIIYHGGTKVHATPYSYDVNITSCMPLKNMFSKNLFFFSFVNAISLLLLTIDLF